ncbi:MAG: LysM peptidoglycan-binding domain-containing protein [Bacteroidales bacterium]|jgi:membrane-bound lytic murein transglycosylase D|nr:LysM peptidoglycan-binding domain-containing protein [Bacteroidales bacterium]
MKRNIIAVLLLNFFLLPGVLFAQSEIEELLQDSTFAVADSSFFNADSLIMTETEINAQNSGEAIVEDSPILKMLDSLYRIRYFSDSILITDSSILNQYGYAANDIPQFADSVYSQRIADLNRETPIDLTYNKHVKSFIELYANRKRELTGRVLGLSYVYYPMFEELLDRYDIPLEMKHLAVVESALNPTAGSHMGAKGLWQFMYGTGKVYDLKVTSLVDDRYDPYKSTEAACQHMLDLHAIYGDWLLVLAAYNSGAGNVNRAIRRAGGTKNYWAIWPFLPRETRGYVPAFIAVNYVMNYAAEHNIYPAHPGMVMHGTDTVSVRDVLAFDQLNEMLGISMEDLRFFNPQFKKEIIPATTEKPYILRIPTDFIGAYLNNEEQLYAYTTKEGLKKEKLIEEIKKVSDRSLHIVRNGENLGLIARKYRVSVNQLMAWNNMRSTMIRPGQKLVVYSSGSPMAQAGSKPVMRSASSSTHTVKSGENLGLIAKKYKCTVTDLKEWNGIQGSVIKPGQKLRVYQPAEETAQNTVTEGKFLIHTVRNGDTLWDIAREYDGVTVDQIKSLNHLNNASRIKPGQKLKIAQTS